MKRITRLADTYDIEDSIGTYIKNKVEKLTTEYKVENIDEFGVIFLIESDEDLVNYKLMGFTEPIDKYIPEYITSIDSRDGISDNEFLEFCYVLSDGFGVILICKESIFTKSFKVDRHSMSIVTRYNKDHKTTKEKR